jgi:hypothetical protein
LVSLQLAVQRSDIALHLTTLCVGEVGLGVGTAYLRWG